MKKTICIILSAILISVFFVIGALADYQSVTPIVYKSDSATVIEDIDDIRALPKVTFPETSTSNFYYVVYRLPNYDDLNSVRTRIDTGAGYASGGRLYYFTDDQSGSSCVSLGSGTEVNVDGTRYIQRDLSQITGQVEYLIYAFKVSSGFTINGVEVEVDMVVPSVWDGISAFITGMFGGIVSIVTGIKGSGNNIVLLFVIVIPLAAICIAYLFKFLGKRRRYRVRRKK